MDTDALATKPDGLAGRAAKSCIDRLNLLLRGETCRSNSKTDSDARNDRRSLEKAQVIENGQLLRSADHSIPVPSSRFPAILSRLLRSPAIIMHSDGSNTHGSNASFVAPNHL